MPRISVIASKPKHKKIGSEVIMNELGSDYSHVTWVFHSQISERKFFFEAILDMGVGFTGQEIWEEKNQSVFMFTKEVGLVQYNTGFEKAMSLCGVKYGFWQNMGIKISKVFGLERNVFSSAKHQINCSELVKLIGECFEITFDEDENLITPKHVVEKLRGLNASV